MDLKQKFARVEEIRNQMLELEAELATLFAPNSKPKAEKKISLVTYSGRVRGRKPGSKMSVEARAKISAAQKKRWAAKFEKTKGPGPKTVGAGRKKR